MTEEIKAPEPVQNAEDLSTADDARLEATLAQPEGDTTPPPDPVVPPADPEQSGEQQAPAPPPPPEETWEQKLAKLEAQVREKEAFIQRQANEVGMLRRIAARPKIDVERVREEIREQFQSDPALATKRLKALDQFEDEVRRDDILMRIPDLPHLIDTMALVAKADGNPDEAVAAFRRDPLNPKLPFAVLQDLALRARTYRWGANYKQQLEAQYGGQAQPPQQPPPQQQTPAQQAPVQHQAPPPPPPPARPAGSPVIKGSTPGGASTSRDTQRFARVTEGDLAAMTDAELDAFLAKDRVR